jgi:ClpP class serine protease
LRRLRYCGSPLSEIIERHGVNAESFSADIQDRDEAAVRAGAFRRLQEYNKSQHRRGDRKGSGARRVGCQNITKTNIAAAIEKARTKRAERTELTQDWVVEELRKIAGANMLDYMVGSKLW